MDNGTMVKDRHLGGYIKGGDGATWYPVLWKWVVNSFGVKSILDVGCGEGHSLEYFKSLGCRAMGLEGCEQAIADSKVSESITPHDFNSGPYTTGQYDMVWCCEVVEHVDEKHLNNVLATFELANMLLMTYAGPGQAGHNHVNCQNESYWIHKMASIDYVLSPDLTRISRLLAGKCEPNMHSHYEQRGLFFIKSYKWGTHNA